MSETQTFNLDNAELEAVFNSLFVPVLIFNADGSLKRVNDAAIQLYGLDPTGIANTELGTRIKMRRADGSAFGFDEMPCNRALRGEHVQHQRLLITSLDGREFNVSAFASPLFSDGAITGAIVAWYDMTQLERAMADIRESRRQVLDVLESTSNGFFALDSLWRVTYINKRAEDLLGLAKVDILFKKLWDKLPNAQVLNLFKEINKAANTVEATSFDEHMPSVDKWFEFNIYPYQNGISVYFSDITKRKAAEEALKKEKDRFEILADSASLLLSAEAPERIVQTICEKVMRFLDCQAFFNYLVEDEQARMHLNAYSGIEESVANEIEWLDFGIAVCGCAARDGHRIIAEDIQHTIDIRADLVRGFGIQAYCAHPLIYHDRVIGTLSFGTKNRLSFADDELEMMKAVANQVAVAMARKREDIAPVNL